MKLLSLKMPYQRELIVGVDSPKLFSKLKIKYGIYIVDCEQSEVPDIRITKIDSSTYAIDMGGTVSTTSSPVLCIDKFLFEHPAYDTSVFAMHGAAVEWRGKCYVFLAATTSGKTTLTSYLVHCGCGYVTDDCVLLDRKTYMVHPFSTPLHLREGGLKVLERYGVLLGDLYCFSEDNNRTCRYIYTPKNCLEQALPLGEIFFIERTETENAICQLSIQEKIAALMKSPITVYPIEIEYLRFLASLGAKYCKCLRYCDMDFVKEIVQQYEN